MERGIRGEDARDLAERILRVYFRTQDYPYTRHHIESYDQFLAEDLPALIQAKNPLLILQDQIQKTGIYAHRAEIYVGGLDGKQLYIGTPTVSLKDSEEGRLLLPNEARLRNLTYSALVEADIVIRVILSTPNPSGGRPISQTIVMDPKADPEQYGYLARYPLFRIPIMLHSRYCTLHGKPQEFLKEAGECIYDHGGYFIVNGAEKVLITHQEQAFNTLYITPQARDPKVEIYSSISCLNPKTRQVKRVSIALLRGKNTLEVALPYMRKPVPLFVVFRALGIQSDADILRLIFPDPEAAETKMLEPMLHESILDAFPFYDTHSAIQYLKVLTKGFSEAHVLHILYNQVFIHVENRPKARATFLAECVRRILRVKAGLDAKTDRDDTRNQRCLTSGVLTRMLFQGIYDNWSKAVLYGLDEEYKYHTSTYEGQKFVNLFLQGNMNQTFKSGMITDSLLRAFRGKWSSGSGAGVGEEKSGVIQALSRLSYMDFMSHCRRVVLDFDTGMKLPSPRRLHTSQYGYFCTSETPGGASIGITKNMSIMTSISTASDPAPFIEWLYKRGGVTPCDEVTPAIVTLSVPVFVNAGIVGYTLRPIALRDTLKVLKWVGALPATASVGFSIRDRRVFIYLDEGRPVRPLIHLGAGGKIPVDALQKSTTWRDLIMGVHPLMKQLGRGIHTSGFVDPLSGKDAPTLEEYVTELSADAGVIEYVDPYEMNEAFVANFPEHIRAETSHMEIHPSTIVGLLTSVIPFANHNQSPRNQLSCSQSKQGLSVYSTAFPNRFDNQVHVLCYGQAPIARTIYYDYLADGQMGYGHNLILAMGCFTGYNQDDGIVMNADSIERGMFRSTFYRSYEAFEEDYEMMNPADKKSQPKTRIGNPAKIPAWTSLRPGIDYTKLDERGIIRVGEMVDETTVLVGRYLITQGGDMRDASVTAQVWTRGRVERVSVMLNNQGLVMVKVRVVQERKPELGDKFSNRHGQKGTIGMLVRSYDMPRRADGIPLDMIMNPHAMPSRMTVAQLLESIVGKAAPALGATANCTLFMNEGSPVESIGKVLRDQLGMEPLGEELLYDGMSGQFVPSQIFVGNVYTMRLKHMPEDKWNARAEGRREQRTHQPTGGRGAQGGLRIGEMERDAILGHGVSDFLRESLMKRADGYSTWICNGCGTIPIFNSMTPPGTGEAETYTELSTQKLMELAKNRKIAVSRSAGRADIISLLRKADAQKQSVSSIVPIVCPACDGPVRFIGDSATNLELLPPTKRSVAAFSKVEIPYAFKLLDQELNIYLNMGMRVLTDNSLKKLRGPALRELTADQERQLLETILPERILPEATVPEFIPQVEEPEVGPEDLEALGAIEPPAPEPETSLGAEAATEAGFEEGIAAAATPAMGVPAAGTNAALPTVMLQPPAAFAAQPALAPGGFEAGAEMSMMPQMQQQQQQQQQQQPQGQVNVQTASQPVLVVPVNVSQPPPAAPTEYFTTGIPGAPPTFAVDTSPNAMAQAGLPALPGPSNRSRSASPRAGPSGAATAAAANARVSVNKMGASPAVAAATSNPNIRVSVTKQG